MHPRRRHPAAALCLLVAVALAALGAQAQRAAAPPPLVAELDATFARARADWDVPGMAVAIVKDGRVVLSKGYGVRERGKNEPVDDQTMFAIASNTKAFTAAAIARLVDQGTLRWDDRVVDHLPYFRLYDEYVTSDMRIRDLLSHRSGLGTFSGDLIWYGTTYSREEVVRRARHLKQAGPFRSFYGYSNVMFIAAGEIVSRVSGSTWDAYVRQSILEPLGMRRTLTTMTGVRAQANVATPHAAFEPPLQNFPWTDWDNGAPAGGIVSTAADMAQWLRLQLGRGSIDGKTIFSDARSREMWTPHVSFTIDRAAAERNPDTHFRAYGLGWTLSDYRGQFVASHAGAADGMFSQVTLAPDEQLGIVVLTNSDTSIGSALASTVVDAYLHAPPRDWSAEGLARAAQARQQRAAAQAERERARLQGTRPSLPLPSYAGSYPSDLYGEARVAVENDRLVLRLVPNPDLVADLTHWQLDTFTLTWRKRFPWFGNGRVQFVLDENARVTQLKLDVPNDDFWFWEPEFLRRDAPRD